MIRLTIVMALAVAVALPAAAQERERAPLQEAGRFGAGLGTTTLITGVNAKYYIANRQSLIANFGSWRGLDFDAFAVGLDYAFEYEPFLRTSPLTLHPYVGASGNIAFFEGGVLGAQVFGGLALQFRDIPLEVTADIRPAVTFGEPARDLFTLGGGVSARWFFF